MESSGYGPDADGPKAGKSITKVLKAALKDNNNWIGKVNGVRAVR